MDDEVQFWMVDGKGPKWLRSAGINKEGQVFIPAAISGNEDNAFLCASYDGEKVCINHGHIYIRSEWMRKEYPGSIELIDVICNRMLQDGRDGRDARLY